VVLLNSTLGFHLPYQHRRLKYHKFSCPESEVAGLRNGLKLSSKSSVVCREFFHLHFLQVLHFRGRRDRHISSPRRVLLKC
jgi:hypothetical protein